MVEERIDFLPGKKRHIYQRRDIFSYSMDAVLLAKFVYIPKKRGKIIDLCAGNGAVPLMLSLRTDAPIVAVEIQEELCRLMEKSIEYNSIDQQIKTVHQDILQLKEEVEWGKYDVVTCNPPYFPVLSTGLQNRNERLTYARHEIACTLEDVIRISSRLVKYAGRLAMVHRPERLTDILLSMRKFQLEPKRIQYVHPKRNREANMVFVEGVKGGNPGLKTMAPLIVYGEGEEYTKEFREYYEQW